MTRSLALAIAALMLASTACGKYGPPVRAADTPVPKTAPAAKTPPVAAAPATGAPVDTEECEDPNAPAAAAKAAP